MRDDPPFMPGIANRTVAEEYFTVSEKVEALYDAPKTLPANAEGTEMTKLRREMHRSPCSATATALAPSASTAHFESICESCTFFQTTIEFRPTLETSNATTPDTKGQVGRKKIFDGLLARLDDAAS